VETQPTFPECLLLVHAILLENLGLVFDARALNDPFRSSIRNLLIGIVWKEIAEMNEKFEGMFFRENSENTYNSDTNLHLNVISQS
jgi:hypothetical protein